MYFYCVNVPIGKFELNFNGVKRKIAYTAAFHFPWYKIRPSRCN